MFNLLVSADSVAWESDQRMRMLRQRFLEYSGDESATISLGNPESLKVLERVQTILLYEDGVDAPNANVARFGRMKDIRVDGSNISFRFNEAGRIARGRVVDL